MTLAPEAGCYDHLVVAHAGPVRLRHKHPDDYPDDYAWRSDPELARYDGTAPLVVPYDEYLRRLAEQAIYEGIDRESFSIDTPGGRHIGNVMYYNATSSVEAAELGMVIADPAFQGLGLGKTVTVAFLRYLFQVRPFRRIVLHTLEWNDRARRCFRAVGFDEVERTRRNLQWFIRMETRREWWLLWDSEGRFERFFAPPPGDAHARGGVGQESAFTPLSPRGHASR